MYKVSVLESIKDQEQILTVTATDADAVLTDEDKTKGYSELRYTLRGDNSDLFTINNVTGVIKVDNILINFRANQTVFGKESKYFWNVSASTQ